MHVCQGHLTHKEEQVYYFVPSDTVYICTGKWNGEQRWAQTLNCLLAASQTVPGQSLRLGGPGVIPHRRLGCGHLVVEGSAMW